MSHEVQQACCMDGVVAAVFWALNGTVNSQNGILKLEIENAQKRSFLRPKVNWCIATPHFQSKNLSFYFSLYFEGSPPAEDP